MVSSLPIAMSRTRIKRAWRRLKPTFIRCVRVFYTAGSGKGLERPELLCPPQLTLRKRYVFLMEKYIEDVKQDEKHVPDLLESIMRRAFFVK